MNGLELLKLLSERFPATDRDGRAPMAVAVAIRVAHDRWTETEDEKYWAEFKRIIFQWSEEIGKLPEVFGVWKD